MRDSLIAVKSNQETSCEFIVREMAAGRYPQDGWKVASLLGQNSWL
jgi:hypothetical protein